MLYISLHSLLKYIFCHSKCTPGSTQITLQHATEWRRLWGAAVELVYKGSHQHSLNLCTVFKHALEKKRMKYLWIMATKKKKKIQVVCSLLNELFSSSRGVIKHFKGIPLMHHCYAWSWYYHSLGSLLKLFFLHQKKLLLLFCCFHFSRGH